MNRQLKVEVDRSGDVPVVRLVGEVDVVSVGRLRAAVAEVLLRSGSLVIDLREVDFIDSAGLGALVKFHSRARALQGQLTCLCLPESQVSRLIRLTGLDRVLRTATTLDAPLDGPLDEPRP